MEKTYTFASNALAAAFVAAVVANHKEGIDAESLETCGLSSARGRYSIYIWDEEEALYLSETADHNQQTISTLAALELAIGEALTLKPDEVEEFEPATKRDFTLREDADKNPTGYTIILRRDGRVTVGCKNFTREGADKVIAVAKLGKKFETFRVPDPTKEHINGHEVLWESDYKDSICVGGDRIQSKHILMLDKIRSKLLAKGAKVKPAPAPKITPFRLFPTPRKRAVKKVSRK